MNKKTIALLIITVFLVGLVIGFFIGKGKVVERPIYTSEIPDYLIERLSLQLGTDDPVKTITEDLMSKTDIIPFDPVLGGKMGFYSAEAIQVLNDRWVVAMFEDGHILGQALLSYNIDESGHITWEVVDAYLE